MLSNECSARPMVIGILITYNYGLKCSLTFSICIEQKRYIVLSTTAEKMFFLLPQNGQDVHKPSI